MHEVRSESMSAMSLIHKATLLLDVKEDVERAISVLREAIAHADLTGQKSLSGEARVFLAQVLRENLKEVADIEVEALLRKSIEIGSELEGEPDLYPWKDLALELLSLLPPTSAELTSMSGSPIYRHGEASAWEPPRGEEFIEEISAHIERHLGPVETVFHEILSDTVHIDVHFVKPTPDFPFVRLVTSGMSDLPMTTPENPDIPKYVELLITLPADWRLDQESFKEEEWYWPLRLLKTLARLPHKYETWLGWGHTVPNGDPPQPYASNTKLSGAIVLPSVTVPQPFHELDIPGHKRITFYAAVPLYESEMNLKLRLGSDELIKRFDQKGVTDVVAIARKDVSRKTFGLW